MRLLLIPVGLAILTLSFTDLVMTTITLHGGGPLSSRIARALWRGAIAINRTRPSHRFLSFMGVTITMAIIAAWVLLFWVGWSTVFFGDPYAIVDTRSQLPADFWARIYFTGFTIVTLGMGDFVPNGDFWEMATALAAASGYTVLGLSISYILSTVSAVVAKRSLAAYISALGRTPEEIVANGWTGRDFAPLTSHATGLTPMVTGLGEQYLAYPVLHYFHAREEDSSAPLSLAALDDALTILEHGVQPENRLEQGHFVPLRGALTNLLSSLNVAYIRAGDVPPPPNLDGLRSRGVPLVSDEEFREACEAVSGRRRLLLALVENDGWRWEVLEQSLGTLGAQEPVGGRRH